MSKQKIIFWIVIAFTILPISKSFASETIFDTHYYSFDMSGKTTRFFRLYVVPAKKNNVFVFTLKNLVHHSDLDIYLYNSSGKMIASSSESGTKTEIIPFPLSSSAFYTIKVYNYGNKWTKGRLYIHSFSFEKILLDTVVATIAELAIDFLIDAILGKKNKNKELQKRLLSAGITIVSSVIEKQNFAHVTRHLVMDQIKQEIHKKYGVGGIVVNFLITFVNKYLDQIYLYA